MDGLIKRLRTRVLLNECDTRAAIFYALRTIGLVSLGVVVVMKMEMRSYD